MPDGEIYGPLDSIVTTLQPGVTNQLMMQEIPGSFPAGSYTFSGYVGIYSDLIYSSDSFPFEKGDSVFVEDPDPGLGGADMTFHFDRPHPNPFNAGTRLSYYLPAAGQVELTLYDISGKRIAILEQGWRGAGRHTLLFSPQNLSSGIYFVRLQAGKWTAVQKVGYVR